MFSIAKLQMNGECVLKELLEAGEKSVKTCPKKECKRDKHKYSLEFLARMEKSMSQVQSSTQVKDILQDWVPWQHGEKR